jgi:transposase-like protein
MCKNKVQFQKGLSLGGFLNKYGTEEQCFDELVKMRWRDGFECPKCGCQDFCRIKRGKMFQCNSCRKQNSVTAGTIFHSTKLPLTKWFLAMYLITQGKSGISQLELSRQVGVSANTGAMLYHKIAQVMLERDSAKKISGKVEIDDAYWGGKKSGKRGRGSKNKVPFVAAVEKNNNGDPMRIKLQVVSGFRKSELKKWSEAHLEKDACVISDGLNCFNAIAEAGYQHRSIIVGNSQNTKAVANFNWVNIVLGNLKTSLAGTFHKLSKEHLPRHLAIFQYRFNRRFVLEDMIPRLAYVSLQTPPMPRRLLKLAESHW